jgi:hypothetical protein
MMLSRRLLAAVAICVLIAPAAFAQQAAAPAAEAAAIAPQQPPLDGSMQNYQHAMIECYRETVPARDPKNPEAVDPAAYKMDNARTQRMSKCLADKGASPPLNPEVQKSESQYFKKGVRNSQASAVSVKSLAVQNKVHNIMEKYQSDAYEQVYGRPPPGPLLKSPARAPESKPGPDSAEAQEGPSGTGSYSPVSAAGGNSEPSLYNATPAPAHSGGTNNNNGGGSLWLPQSQ